MYNTPVYNNDEPHESPFNKIFIIEHGIENNLVPVRGAKGSKSCYGKLHSA